MARFAITSLVFMLLEVPDPVWKMSTRNCVVVLAGGDLVRGGDDGVGELAVQLVAGAVDLGGGLLDQRQRADHPARQPQPADGEVLDGPLRLRAVQRVRGDFDLAQRITFGPVLGLWSRHRLYMSQSSLFFEQYVGGQIFRVRLQSRARQLRGRLAQPVGQHLRERP